ncbi:hypothetical protein OK016_27225 [Vibrio chagasii]|nr:hypothetical protein [Vibrio chagasii]
MSVAVDEVAQTPTESEAAMQAGKKHSLAIKHFDTVNHSIVSLSRYSGSV